MEGRMQPPTGAGSRKRQNLTLDLNTSSSKRNKVQSLLTSPDVQMLKLTSPELEKFLIQNPSLATPTPNGYGFPKSVTEEQIMYAKGFEEALEQMKQADSTQTITEASAAAATTLACLSNVAVNHSAHPAVVTTAATAATTSTADNLPLSLPSSHSDSRPSSAASGSIDSVKVKDEPEDQSLSGSEYTASITSPGGAGQTAGVSPIDMDTQEIIKLERKRMRNRLAASKCRKRKLERISLLDERVKQLKTENTDLAAVVKKMKASVALLKQEVIEHVNSGCQIRMTDAASFS